jgi:tryptophan 6-halogenase
MDTSIRSVVILGGGTAGWMTAAYLGKALQETVRITVIEAPSIPRIGVGEASVPNLQRAFFDYLGIAEEDWMRECNASFKTAVKFINWRTPGENSPVARTFGGRPDHFYHPFGLLPDQDGIPLSHFWAYRRINGQTDEQFDYACFKEPAIMDAKLAPKYADGRPATYYAWHFDAQLLADFLCRFATNRQGVVHVRDEMTDVELDDRGFITGLRVKGGDTIEGDLFVDCSGFRGLLINQAMREPFVDMSDHLLCDSAVATAVPHDDASHGVEPYTSSIAMKSGWTWRIPMLGRFGTGYVYASRFAEREEAAGEFRALWGLDEDQPLNHIRFRVGRNERAWVKNCVSIGLSSCFVEPLESTGIYFTYGAIYHLVKHFPDRSFEQTLVDSFNREIKNMFDDTRDFLQAHFYLSPRVDTPFWKYNKELTLADDITEKVAKYLAGLPINQPAVAEASYYQHVEAEFRNFWTNGSYYCIFTGMGMVPEKALPIIAHTSESVRAAESLFDKIKSRQRELVATLPSNYEFLRQLHGVD